MFEHLHSYWDTIDIKLYAGTPMSFTLANTIVNHYLKTFVVGQLVTYDEAQFILHAFKEYANYKGYDCFGLYGTSIGFIEIDPYWTISESWLKDV